MITKQFCTSANHDWISRMSLGIYPWPFLFGLINNLDLLCLQWEKNSLFELRSANLGLNRMWYFSLLHRVHTLVTGVNDFPLSIMLQLISYCMFSLSNLWMWLLKDVWLLLSSLNVCLCCPSLASKLVDVRPI